MSDIVYVPSPPHEFTRFISLHGMFHNDVDHDDRKMIMVAEGIEDALNRLGIYVAVKWTNIPDAEINTNGDLGRFLVSIKP